MKKIILIVALITSVLFCPGALDYQFEVARDTNIFGLTCYGILTVRNIEAQYLNPSTGEFFYIDSNDDGYLEGSYYYNWKVECAWESGSVYYIQVWNLWGTKLADWRKRIEEDTTAPYISLSPSDWSTWHNGSFTVTASGNDYNQSGVNVIYYRINGGGWITSSPATSLSVTLNNAAHDLPSGTHTLSFYTADMLGNNRIQDYTIRIDETNPVVTFNTSQNWFSAASLQAYATATDTHSGYRSSSWQYKSGTGAWSAEGSGNYHTTITEEGETLVSFQVKDYAGNQSNIAIGAVRLDRTAPRLTVQLQDEAGSPLQPGWQKQNVKPVLTADDSKGQLAVSGIKSLRYRRHLNGILVADWTPLTLSGNTASLLLTEPGDHTLDFELTDNADNQAVSTYHVMIDKTNPVISSTGVCIPAAGPGDPSVDNWITLAAGEAAYAFARAEDTLSGIKQVTWGTDGIAYPNTATYDAATGNYLAGAFNSETIAPVYFKAEDNAGRSITAQYTVQIDQTTPGINLPAIPGNWQAAAAVSLNFTGIDRNAGNTANGAGFAAGAWELSRDGTAWEPVPGTDNALIEFTDPGENSYYIRVTDKVGHTSPVYSFTLKLDPEVPQVTAGDTGWLAGTTADIDLTVTDTSGVDTTNLQNIRYSFNYSEYNPVSAITGTGSNLVITIPVAGLADGVHPLYLKVKDRAGREYAPASTGTPGCYVKMDRSNPVINTAAVPAGWFNAAGITLSLQDGTGAGINSSTFAYSLDGSTFTAAGVTWQNATTPFVPLNADGTYPLFLRVSDLAARQSTATITIRRDTVKPAVTAGDTDWISGAYQWINLVVSDAQPGSGANLAANRIYYRKTGATAWQQVTGLETSPALRVQVNIVPAGGYCEQPVELRIEDLAGNTSDAAACLVRVDNASPLVNTAPLHNIWTTAQPIVLSLDGTGAPINPAAFRYGFSAATVTIDDADVQLVEGTWQAFLPGINEGERTVYFSATDTAGNTAVVSAFLRVDRTAPAVVLNSTGIISGATASLSVTDSGAGLNPAGILSGFEPGNLSAEGIHITGSNGTWIVEVPVNGDGPRTLYVQASDMAGNMVSRSFPVTLDSGGPDLVLSAAAGWVTPSAVVTATASDAIGSVNTATWAVQLTTENADYNSSNWNPITPVPGNPTTAVYTVTASGTWKVWFKVKDDAGNSGIAFIMVQVDAVLPQVTCSGGMTVWTAAGSAQVSAAATDIHSGIDPDSWAYRIGLSGAWTAGNSITISEQGERNIYFRVSDLAGNTATAGAKVMLDNTGPVITDLFLAHDYVITTLQITGQAAVDAHAGLDAGSWLGSLDAGNTRMPLTQVIDVTGLEPGNHSLLVQVADLLGNTSQVNLAFVVDRESPSLVCLELLSGGNPVGEEVFLSENQVMVSVSATDNAMAANRNLTTQYVLLAGYTETPDFSAAAETIQDSFLITGLGNGINYLYLRLKDYAGNLGAVSTRMIRVDTSAPQPPGVTSLTHPAAVTEYDAVAACNALFLLQPAGSGNSGIFAYHYTLRKGAALFLEGTETGTRLELTGLPDNDLHEFYTLSAQAVAGNGRVSAWTTYTFRIDTSPPVNLKVVSSTHANADIYYDSAAAGFRWNRPLDFTGVKTFYYKYADQEIIPQELPAGFAPDPTWSRTTGTTVALDFQALTGSAAGIFRLAVCAEDYAGNLQFDQTMIRYDTVKPTCGDLTLLPDFNGRSVSLSWTQCTDNIAADRIEMALARESGPDILPAAPALVFPPAAGTKTLEGLDQETVYLLYFTVYDTAGNTRVLLKKFSLLGELGSDDTAVPFTANLKGFTIQGAYSLNPAKCSASVMFDASLGFALVDPGNGALLPAASLPLSSLEFDPADGSFLSGLYPRTATFTATLAGYSITGEGFTVSAANGLVFDTIHYATNIINPATGLAEAGGFTYNQVQVQAPPQVLISPVGSSAAATFDYQTGEGWDFSGVKQTGFQNDNWLLLDGRIDLENIHGYVLQNGTPVYQVNTAHTALTPAGDVVEADITEEFFLELSGSLFLVHQALVRGDKIIILDASLLLAEGLTPEEVHLANFSVDINGIVAEEAGFAFSAFSLTQDGAVYAITSLGFADNYLVIRTGTVTTGAFTLPITGAGLQQSGVTYDLTIRVPYFETWLHGFPVTSSDVQFTSTGILLETADIRLPAALGGNNHTINGLMLAKADAAILQPGVSGEVFLLDTGYGSEVTVTGLLLNATGLFAAHAAAGLPAFAGAGSVDLTLLPLYSNGTTGTRTAADAIQLTIGGFTLSGEGAVFDGKTFSFADIILQTGEEFAAGELVFTGFTFNYLQVLTAGRSNPATFMKDNWPFAVENLSLDATGITGLATLLLPVAFGEKKIVFPAFRFLPGGGYQTGTANGELFFRLQGWKVQGQGLSLEGPDLHLAAGTIILPSIMGAGQLPVPDLVLNSAGSLVSSGTGENIGLPFQSTNGFNVTAESFTFRETGLYLSGKIYFPAALGSDVFLQADDIYLDRDGSVQLAAAPGPVVYQLAGWDITAAGITIDGEGLLIEHNKLQVFNNVFIDVPAVRFYPDGNIKVAGLDFTGFSHSLGGFTLGITEVCLNTAGLNVKCFITLPPFFDNVTIYFDKLTIHPDGSITTDAALPVFSFELGEFQFHFGNITFDDDRFNISLGEITLPPAAESRKIRIKDFQILNDGSFILGGIAVEPFELWGYVFHVQNIGFANGVVDLSGSIRFPENFPVDGLQGASLNINDFKISLDGTVQSFSVSINDPLSFQLYDSWEIVIDAISVNQEYFRITSGTLNFPAELGIDSVTVHDFTINIKTGEIGLGSVTIDGITREWEGCVFTLDTIRFSAERGVEFTGSVVLGGNIPADFAGLSLIVDMFQIRPDFTIGDISARLTGINRNIFDLCILKNGSLGFTRTGEEFILSCSGLIEFGSGFPAGIAGKTVDIHDFRIDVTTGAIIALSATAGNLAYNLLGLCDVTGSSLTFALNQDSGLVDISVTGTLVLSAAFPEFLAGQHITIDDFTIDTSGSIKSFSAALTIAAGSTLFGGIKTGGVTVAVSISNNRMFYSVAGSVLLDQSFGEGLAGARFTISTLELDGSGNLLDLDIAGAFPGAPLFGTFDVENGYVHLAMDGPDNIITTVSGNLRFGSVFPEGLRGKALTINAFSIAATGEILAFSASAADLALDLFGITRVEADTITFSLDSLTGNIRGAVSGRLYLSTLFPADLRQEPINITRFEFSSAGIITAFEADLNLAGDRNLFGGLLLRNGKLRAVLAGNAVTFDVNGTVLLPAAFPAGLAGQEIAIEELVFDSNGTITTCHINTAVNNLMLFNTIKIVNGNIVFHTTGAGGLALDITGLLQFSDLFPEGIRGKYLTLSAFSVSSGGAITAFAAATDPLTINLFGLTRMTNTVISMSLNNRTGVVDISVGGDLYLGSAFPAALRQDPITVHNFTIDTAGNISAFDASVNPAGDRVIFDALILKNSEIRAVLNGQALEFGITGTIELAPVFPEGIAGTAVTISGFRFNQQGQIIVCDLTANLVDQELFGVLPLEDARVRIVQQSGGGLVIDVGCGILLPSFFPDGLAGQRISVNTFKISSGGEILEIDAGITNLNTSIFGVVPFKDASLLVQTSQTHGLVFNIAGKIVLPGYLPAGLANRELIIQTLTLSPTEGIIGFRAGISTAVEFDIFAGIKGRFTQLLLGMDGFSLAGDVTFPADFPEGLANRTIALQNFAMNWNGRITAINAVLPAASIELAGFTATISNLSISGTKVNIEYISLSLPPVLNSQVIGIANAGFDYNGNFFGRFVVPYLEFDLAGCKLTLNQPSLNLDELKMSFTSVVMKLPVAIGGQEFTINGVQISPSGLKFTGGKFEMPDFTIAGGMWFKNIFVEVFQDGSNYSIEGGGAVFIPGLGELSVQVGFANKSDIYPWGLKYAELEYVIDGLGLPVGTTGIYVNGINGAVAFGPPGAEMPPALRKLFGPDGTRIKVGLHMRDISGSITGSTKVWVNIDTWDWAVMGEMAVLGGTIKAEVMASLTRQYGFYATLFVQIVFVRGSAYIHIWNKDNRTYLCGAIAAELKVPEGLAFGIWPGKDEEIWLGGIGVEFGDFSGGSKGFKAFVDIPVAGQVGVFITTAGNFTLGSVSEYQLADGGMLPEGSRAAASAPPYARSAAGNVVLRDLTRPAGVTRNFRLEVPGKAQLYNILPQLAGRSSADRSGAARAAGADPFEEKVEKLFFVVRYTEGDPLVTAVSASHTVYDESTPGVEVLRTNMGLIMAIANPEPGSWQLTVTNLLDGQEYEISAYGKNTLPRLQITAPAFSGELVNGQYEIRGNLTASTGTLPQVQLYLGRDNYSFTGESLGQVTAGTDGTFSFVYDTGSLAAGEYFIFAQADDGSFAGQRVYAPGSLVVQAGNQPLEAPTNLIATVNDATTLELAFTDPNGGRCTGFNLYLQKEGNPGEQKINLGYLPNTTLSGLTPGSRYTSAVTAYDAAGNESRRSTEVSIVLHLQDAVINAFELDQDNLAINMLAGEDYSGVIHYAAPAPQLTGTAFDQLDYSLVEAPKWLYVYFDREYWPLVSGSGEIRFTLAAATLPAPGVYTVRFTLANMGNRQLKHEVVMSVTVAYPQPLLTRVEPGEWNNLDSVLLTIRGDNFLAGSKLLLDNTELVISGMTKTTLCAQVAAGITAGTKTLAVKGPGGQQAAVQVTVVEPSYIVQGYKTVTTIAGGAGGTVIFGIEAVNRFTGTAHFEPETTQPGWLVSMDSQDIGTGEYITAAITVPAEAETGSYPLSFRSDRGDILPVMVTVVETAIPEPVIASLSSNYGYRGESITLFGSGFGTSATAQIGSAELSILSCANDRITALVPQAAASGAITVTTGAGVSNAVYFVVKNLGFRLFTQADTFTAQPGESLTATVTVAGYADWVDLTAASTALQVTLDKTGLKPNGQVLMTIAVPAATEYGSYAATLTAASGSYQALLTITVNIGENFTITTEQLPGCMAGVSWYCAIASVNGEAPVSFTTAGDTSLPPGLNLTPAGVLSGRPAAAGSYSFTIQAADARGRTSTRNYQLIIEENNWALPYKDSGRTGYNPVDAPAAAGIKWTSETLSSLPLDILTGEGRVFVRTASGVTGLHTENGRRLFVYTGAFTQWAYNSRKLFLLDTAGVFHAVDAQYGNLLWQRNGVSCFTIDGSTLYLQEDGMLKVIDISGGLLSAEIPALLPADSITFRKDGELYALNSNRLQKLAAGTWVNAWEAGEPLIDAAADDRGFLLLTAGGILFKLDNNLQAAGSIATGLDNGKILAGSTRIYVYSSTGIRACNRADLELLFTLASSQAESVLGGEKLLSAADGQVTARNGYTGSVIWQKTGNYIDLALAGELLYALKADGSVECFNSKANIHYPQTTLLPDPAQPQGERGYYTVIPTVTISAADPESIVAGTYYRFDDGDWQLYSQPVQLHEGEYTFAAYSIDDHTYREPDRVINLQVDATAPVTTLEISGNAGNNNYYTSAVTVSLAAADNVSGVETIYYRVNNAPAEIYTSPFVCSAQDLYTIRYYAKDRAGNYETEQVVEFGLDLENPTAAAVVYIEPGAGVVYLSADDTFSGIAGIEYVLDNNPAVPAYLEPVVITAAGNHSVVYRAVDKAGRWSSWQQCSVVTPPLKTGDWIENIEYSNWKPGRQLIRDIRTGDRLYTPDSGSINHIQNLPDYLVGADYLLQHLYDKLSSQADYVSFQAVVDVDVYIMKHDFSPTVYNGWQLIEENFPVSAPYFPGGADIYKRSFAMGETITLPGSNTTNGWANLIFVQFALSNYVKIVCPQPGTILRPGETVHYYGVVSGIAYAELEFDYKLNGETTVPGFTLSGDITLPFLEGENSLTFELRVKDAEGNIITEKTVKYNIINSFTAGLVIPAPVLPGTLRLKGESETLPGFFQEETFILQAVERYSITVIERENDTGRCCENGKDSGASPGEKMQQENIKSEGRMA